MITEAKSLTNSLRIFATGAVGGAASALLASGDVEGALDVARQGVVEAAAVELEQVELELQIERAQVAARAGHQAEARTALARARELATGMECRILVPAIHEAAGLLAETLGDSATRDAERREALRLYRELGADGHVERLARELGIAGTAS